MLLAVLVSYLVACTGAPHRLQVYAPIQQVLAELDDFGTLLLEAGLPSTELPRDREVSATEAQRLSLALQLVPITPQQYGPRLVADALLHEVVEKGKSVSRAELTQRIQRYQTLYVLRPDGYLSPALTGAPSECVGPVTPQDGTLKAGTFEMGAFYIPDSQKGWIRVLDVSDTSAR